MPLMILIITPTPLNRRIPQKLLDLPLEPRHKLALLRFLDFDGLDPAFETAFDGIASEFGGAFETAVGGWEEGEWGVI